MGFDMLGSAWSTLTNIYRGVTAAVSSGVKTVQSWSKPKNSVGNGAGGGGGGVFGDDNGGTGGSGSGSSSGSGSVSGSSDGSGDGSEETSNDNTTENVVRNDPEKNKLLAEVRMSEELRETFTFTLTLPVILKGLHTNQWLFLEVPDSFYEENYPTLIGAIANKKYGRYAGFEKGRFFVEKIRETGGIDGVQTEITLNPIASNYGQYVKMQMDAEKALIDAMNDDTKYENNSGYGSGGSVSKMTLDEIYNIAATFKYGGAGTGLSPEKAWQYYQGGGRTFDCFDCSNWLFYCLREKHIRCRIVTGHSDTSKSGTHRVVQIYENGEWHCPKQAWNLTSLLRPFTPEDKYPLKTLLEYNGSETI